MTRVKLVDYSESDGESACEDDSGDADVPVVLRPHPPEPQSENELAQIVIELQHQYTEEVEEVQGRQQESERQLRVWKTEVEDRLQMQVNVMAAIIKEVFGVDAADPAIREYTQRSHDGAKPQVPPTSSPTVDSAGTLVSGWGWRTSTEDRLAHPAIGEAQYWQKGAQATSWTPRSREEHQKDTLAVFSNDGTERPVFKFHRHPETVEEQWAEFRYGLHSQPPVERLEELYRAKWRNSTYGRSWFTRRKAFWDKVKDLLAEGRTEQEALGILVGNGFLLDQFFGDNVNQRTDDGVLAVENDFADAVSYGRRFIPNPDLVLQIRLNQPLSPYDRDAFYTHGARGYTTYLASKPSRTWKPRWMNILVVGNSESAIDIVLQSLPHVQSDVYVSRKSQHPRYSTVFDKLRIKVVATLDCFEANTIHLMDGMVIVGVNMVIFATGYFYTYPFLSHVLPQPQGPGGHRVPGLYQHIFDLHNLNTIASVGAANASLTWISWEKAAFSIALLWSGRLRLPSPSREAMLAWEKRRLAEKGDRVFHVVELPYKRVRYFDDLNELATEYVLDAAADDTLLQAFPFEYVMKLLATRRWKLEKYGKTEDGLVRTVSIT
ncbi:thiol-specific monooxygenase [Colletotrichum higginsianum]|uniref:Thiol-specific monooxygenase n=1 Tax=Colletotrichum higginsianum (strain IMI 349063) TaxID=759273 RepID=H1VLL7_COLHI|nr:thiol-specific monooxygenase [Colletotrichum higginsianum]